MIARSDVVLAESLSEQRGRLDQIGTRCRLVAKIFEIHHADHRARRMIEIAKEVEDLRDAVDAERRTLLEGPRADVCTEASP